MVIPEVGTVCNGHQGVSHGPPAQCLSGSRIEVRQDSIYDHYRFNGQIRKIDCKFWVGNDLLKQRVTRPKKP